MGSLSIWHWLIVLLVVLILFGGSGKIARLAGDMAKGINAFKKNLKAEESGTGDDATKTLEAERLKKDEAAKG
jgi:sec-independent protein translocase protein TatA